MKVKGKSPKFHFTLTVTVETDAPDHEAAVWQADELLDDVQRALMPGETVVKSAVVVKEIKFEDENGNAGQ